MLVKTELLLCWPGFKSSVNSCKLGTDGRVHALHTILSPQCPCSLSKTSVTPLLPLRPSQVLSVQESSSGAPCALEMCHGKVLYVESPTIPAPGIVWIPRQSDIVGMMLEKYSVEQWY